MFTSVTSPEMEKQRTCYLLAACFCMVFAMVYEYVSFQVYSPWMVFAPAVPLLGGALPAQLLRHWKTPNGLGLWLWGAGIASLTVGCILQGVLEIYGTAHPLTAVYLWVSIPLFVLGILFLLVKKEKV